LLDACVKTVGNPFAREMSSRDTVATSKQGYLVANKQWAEEYQYNPGFCGPIRLWILSAISAWIPGRYLQWTC
ncbi:hypothetical protein TSMEX_007335, partial [Taenia solium]